VAVLVSRELVRSARRLESALAQVRAADRIKTEFLGNVSHELRTPLNGVMGMAQLLQLRHQDPESRDRLLDSARLETGAMTLDRTAFEPAAALEEVVRLIGPEVGRKGLDLRVAIAPEARRPLLGDALAFRQIGANLIGNAAKFTDSGRITVLGLAITRGFAELMGGTIRVDSALGRGATFTVVLPLPAAPSGLAAAAA
jgi:signal transduction histidine kinase